MEILFYITIGIIIGAILEAVISCKDKIYGFIDVDQHTGMCKIRISSEEIANRKNKKAIFIINHDANISREEQSL